MKAEELLKAMKSTKPPVVVDVRTGLEYRHGHIPGAVHAPGWRILLRLARIPKDREEKLVVTCEHGPRAAMAEALLRKYGYRNVVLLDGQMAGWRRKGLPLQRHD